MYPRACLRYANIACAALAALTLSACNLGYALFGLPEPTIDVAGQGSAIELPYREGPGGLVLIKARVNDLAEAEFVLDTGAPVTVLLDGPQSRDLRLDSSKAVKLGDPNNPATPIGDVQRGFRLDFGDVKLSNLTAVVIPVSTLSCQQRFEEVGFQGVIGANLLRRFVVQIDPARRVVRLMEPATFKPDAGEVLPLAFSSGQIFADIPVELAGGVQPLRVHVDTGMSRSLVLVAGSHPALVMPRDGKVRKSCYVAGTVDAVAGEDVALRLGALPARPVQPIYEANRDVVGGRQGAIGMGLLKDYLVTFDYPGKRMILAPRA